MFIVLPRSGREVELKKIGFAGLHCARDACPPWAEGLDAYRWKGQAALENLQHLELFLHQVHVAVPAVNAAAQHT